MVYLNFAVIEGNITRDAEVRHVTEGNSVTAFTIANNESFMNSKNEEVSKANFIHVEIWGESFAQKVSPHLKKGISVRVYGKIRSDFWISDDGTKKERVFIRGTNLDFVNYSKANGKSANFKQDDDSIDDTVVLKTIDDLAP